MTVRMVVLCDGCAKTVINALARGQSFRPSDARSLLRRDHGITEYTYTSGYRVALDYCADCAINLAIRDRAMGLDAPPSPSHNPGNPGRGDAVGEGGNGTDG